jgi:prevent-host-death family protein
MFEIQDEKLGKLKIFNVTEARANFATVLKEHHAKVVITNHGRPTKILIPYEEYTSMIKRATGETDFSLGLASTIGHRSIRSDFWTTLEQ